uniref:Uncharacterized protein n=1 Tax=Timema genevievae TaxID=629358 RepID=A0A7R9K8A6_TIMGE|nr:unnamed protein product [Timema genevievae]
MLYSWSWYNIGLVAPSISFNIKYSDWLKVQWFIDGCGIIMTYCNGTSIRAHTREYLGKQRRSMPVPGNGLRFHIFPIRILICNVQNCSEWH